jgi:hypothetical protein
VAAAATFASIAGRAHAASVTATLDDTRPARVVGLNYNGAYLGIGYAGTLNWHVTADDGAGLPGSFSSYCIDLLQDVYVGHSYTFTLTDVEHTSDPQWPTRPTGAGGLDAVHAGYLGNLYASQLDTVGTDADRAAAFQIALWEILYDTSSAHDVATGQFSVRFASNNVVAIANQFVAAATASGSSSPSNTFTVLTSPNAQDQLFVGARWSDGPIIDLLPNDLPPGDGLPTPVPVPAAAVAALPLLAGIAAVHARRQRRLA